MHPSPKSANSNFVQHQHFSYPKILVPINQCTHYLGDPSYTMTNKE